MSSAQILSYMADMGVHGRFYLDIAIRGAATAARGVLLDALALHKLEHITRSLEDTFLHSLEWHRCSEEKPVTQLLEMNIECRHGSALMQAALRLPVAELSQLAHWKIAGNDNLQGMFWKPVACTLFLSRLQLSTDEYAELGEGALVIIPESFKTSWSSTLRIVDSGLSLQGEYQCSEGSWLRTSEVGGKGFIRETGVDTAEPEPWDTARHKKGKLTFSLELECQLNPASLLQVATPDKPVLHKIVERERGISECCLLNDVGVRFHGKLLALGAGRVLLLQQKMSVEP